MKCGDVGLNSRIESTPRKAVFTSHKILNEILSIYSAIVQEKINQPHGVLDREQHELAILQVEIMNAVDG